MIVLTHEELQAEVSRLEAELIDLEENNYQLGNKVDDHDLEIQEREDKIRDLEDDVDEHNDKIKELQENLPSEDEHEQLSRKMAEYQSTVPGTPLSREVGEEVRKLIENVLIKLIGSEGPITIP